MTARDIAMPLQHCAQASQIVGRLQRIEIVGTFAQHQTRGMQLIESCLIAQPYATPIIALKKHQRTIKMKPGDGKQILASLP